jgi:hypothetical protein
MQTGSTRSDLRRSFSDSSCIGRQLKLIPTKRRVSTLTWEYRSMRARSVDSAVPTMVNMRSPVSSCGTLAMEMREPERRRISVILEPPRPLSRVSHVARGAGNPSSRAEQKQATRLT